MLCVLAQVGFTLIGGFAGRLIGIAPDIWHAPRFMALPRAIELADEDKLQVLRRLDQFRPWRSLDDKRYCLSCGTILTGRDIVVIGGTRGNGPLRVMCPTQRCHSITMDWALPTDEVLAKNFTSQPGRANPASASERTHIPERWFAASLRKLATRFRRIP